MLKVNNKEPPGFIWVAQFNNVHCHKHATYLYEKSQVILNANYGTWFNPRMITFSDLYVRFNMCLSLT